MTILTKIYMIFLIKPLFPLFLLMTVLQTSNIEDIVLR